MKHAPASRRARSAFTLLEVLLALTILVGCLATIGELTRMGMQNAHRAAAGAQAQVYCESKLAEITSGIAAPTSVGPTPLTDDPLWLYSVTAEPTVDASLLSVRVTVMEDLPPERGPVQFTLVRWMIDPQTAATEEATTESTSSSSTGATP